MKNIRHLSNIFILKSKVLTFSCVISICTAIVLIVSMSNFSINAKNTYTKNLHEMYGDFDIILTYEDNQDISKECINKMNEISDIENIGMGRTSNLLSIQGTHVYALGVEDSEMMKSRYHYITALSDGIVINKVLAEILQCNIGNIIDISGNDIPVDEIIRNDAITETNIALAIMSQNTLSKLTGESTNANFLMVKAKDNISINKLVDKIIKVDSDLKYTLVQTDSYYKKSVESFSIYIFALIISVMVVATLFVLSIFRNFIYKYNHDLAIIRAIGGRPKQILQIFGMIVIKLCGIACTLGYILTYLLYNFINEKILDKINLIKDSQKFNVLFSLKVTLIIFLLLVVILLISIKRNSKVLPIAAIQQNEINKIGKRKIGNQRYKKSLFNILLKFIDKDFYISVRLISKKINENIFIILTIMMIVVLSFVGSSLSSIIKVNNSKYLKNQYLTDIVVTNSSSMSYSDTQMIYNELKKEKDIQVSLVLTNGPDMTMGNQSITYHLADLTAMEQQGILNNSVNDNNRIVVSKEFAEELSVEVGDSISVKTPGKYLYDEHGLRVGFLEEPVNYKLYISAILPKEKISYGDAYINIELNDFLQDNMGMNCVYISGDLKKAENILNNLKCQYPNLVWSNYKDVVEKSNKEINQRYVMFEIVTNSLILVAGLGWFNSIRSIIISRKKEYCLLRIQGVSMNRLRKIIIFQILIYLLIGIVGGVLVGSIILMLLMYREQKSYEIIINIKITIQIIIYLSFLSILLLPMTNRISKDKLIQGD